MSREAALEIVTRLQQTGYLAYFVGGCVRDMLLERDPKDFDIATSARPDQVLQLFPYASLIGASFGVALVNGIEVATFRSDQAYTDGRHPTSVAYETDPRLDASRRDFTINAMFFDPVRNELHDFFGGREDLASGLIRAIGDPRQRFAEDHLRMLRAVRFAARFNYTIEADTFAAMQELHANLSRLAVERVREEMTLILTTPLPAYALKLLNQSQLFPVNPLNIQLFELLAQPIPSTLAWATLLYPNAPLYPFKFSRQDMVDIRAILRSQEKFTHIEQMTKADLKRFLRQPHFDLHLQLHSAICLAQNKPLAHASFATQQLAHYSKDDLNPSPLLDGADLISLGLTPGPKFSQILDQLEEEQLAERITTRDQAVALANSLIWP